MLTLLSQLFFCLLQRYDPVVQSGNLYTNETLSTEIHTLCSHVDWDEAVSVTIQYENGRALHVLDNIP